MINDTFIKACKQLGITPTPITFHVTQEVKNELQEIAGNNDCTLQELLRDLTDDFLEHQPQ